MKRRDLLRAIQRMAQEHGVEFSFVRHGGRHDLFRLGEVLVTVPRHAEIAEGTARAILRQAEQSLKGDGR